VENTELPHNRVEYKFLSEDLHHLLVKALFLQQPIDRIEAEDLSVAETVGAHELKNIIF